MTTDIRDPVNVIRDASAVAARLPDANHLSQAGRQALPVRVHLSIGEYEQKHAPYIAPDSPRAQMLKARGQVDRVRAFTRHLNETLPGLPVSFTEHPRSTHGSSQLYAVLDALRFASGTSDI